MSLPDREVRLVIRYDDFGAAYGPACAARFEVEQMLQSEMAARGWPWVCSITPRQSVDPEDVDEERVVSLSADQSRVALLRRAVADGLCEPAVHGLTHHTWKPLRDDFTEFAGLPADSQYEILARAKRDVEELVQSAASVFVPPWNTFDERTVEAATRAGFRILSAGTYCGCSGAPPLRLVPATVDLRDLRGLVGQRRRFFKGSVVVVLFHAFDFVSVDPQKGHLRIDDFGPLLDRVADEMEMQATPMSRIPETLGPDLEDRFAQFKRLHVDCVQLRNIPVVGPSLSRRFLSRTFWWALIPTKAAARLRRTVTAIGCLWLALAAAAASVPALVLGRLLNSVPARSIGLLALALGAAVLGGRSAWYAFIKRYRARWGAGPIGWRTWTGLLGGSVAAVTALLEWLHS